MVKLERRQKGRKVRPWGTVVLVSAILIIVVAAFEFYPQP